VRASAGVGASLGAQQVEAFDRDLAELLRSDFPKEPMQVLHRAFAVVARGPS
jgi:hypothetical protein